MILKRPDAGHGPLTRRPIIRRVGMIGGLKKTEYHCGLLIVWEQVARQRRQQTPELHPIRRGRMAGSTLNDFFVCSPPTPRPTVGTHRLPVTDLPFMEPSANAVRNDPIPAHVLGDRAVSNHSQEALIVPRLLHQHHQSDLCWDGVRRTCRPVSRDAV